MKLNTKTRYGLRAMIEIAESDQKGLFQKDIVEKQHIPMKYLDTIITGLRTSGLIMNFKGKRSGYILSRPATEITVYDIYCSFEPELAIVECLCKPNQCELKSECKARPFWNEVNNTLISTFKQKKLSDFLENS